MSDRPDPLAYLEADLDDLRGRALYRPLRVMRGPQTPVTTMDGRSVISLSSNNYLGLATHPRLVEAALGAVRELGVGSGAVRTIAGTMELHEALEQRYARESFVRVLPIAEPLGEDERVFDPEVCNGTNRIDLHVVPNPVGHVLLIALVDNLGKGAAGAAVQNLNLMLGLSEDAGLRVR